MIWIALAGCTAAALAVVCGFLIRQLRIARRECAASHLLSTRLIEARENERKQIAEELHDSLGQNLLIINSRAQLGLAAAVNPPAAQQFAEISKTCLSAINETREIAHSLGPRYLTQLGLTEALDAMMDRVAASTNIRIERKFEPVNDLFAVESATSLYRSVQEALNNIMKHSHATEARVQIIRDLRHVELIVQDNGCGFDAARVNGVGQGGIGLLELSERARMLGGRLDIQSQPGRGTKLSVIIPFHAGEGVHSVLPASSP